MDNGLQPIFSHAEPVLAVNDVAETILYWQQSLGFPTKWTWGDPPTLGAVSWHGAFIQFLNNPKLADSSKGNAVWIRLQHVEKLYTLHQKNNVEIVDPLEQKPYGLAQYCIRDINGYYICFAGALSERDKSEGLPPEVRIVGRIPTIQEYREVSAATNKGAHSLTEGNAEKILAAVVYAAVAEDTLSNQVIGCALLTGDGASFYYVKDVFVHPAWQGKRLGTALMHELNNWLENNAATGALVGLFTGENLEPFYQQFGFAKGFGMVKYMHHEKEDKPE